MGNLLGALILASAIVYCGQLDLSGGALAVHALLAHFFAPAWA